MKKTIIAYRENDLFNSYMSEIIEGADEVKVFSRETTQEEIDAWRNQNIDDSVTYISDETCGVELGMDRIGILDDLFRVTAEMAILGGVRRMDNDLENSGKAFQSIIKKVVEKNAPGRIAISVSRYLCSHQPFSSFSNSTEVAEKIKAWLVEAGIPKGIIKLGYSKQDDDLRENWVIYDRHDFIQEKYDRPEIALNMCIPVETLYEQCLNAGLITEASADEFLHQLKKNFKRVLEGDVEFLSAF